MELRIISVLLLILHSISLLGINGRAILLLQMHLLL